MPKLLSLAVEERCPMGRRESLSPQKFLNPSVRQRMLCDVVIVARRPIGR
jgi:hypothetical protein